jgi:regulator of sigma E protease
MITVLKFAIGIAGLGLMIFIHEFAHFIAAKLNGVDVEVFSLGWGKKLVGFMRGGTSYQISWFPIGGYCKMKGEEFFRQAQIEGLPEIPKEKGSFYAVPPWRRIIIHAAGPIANVISALLILTLIWWIGFRIFSSDNRIIVASGTGGQTPAQAAGLVTGDRIIAINGTPLDNFQDIRGIIVRSADKMLTLTVSRDVGGGRSQLELAITPKLDSNTGGGEIGIYPWYDPIINTVVPGTPAALAGLRKGDRIVEADDTPVRNSFDLGALLSAKPTRITLTYERDGTRSTITIVPRIQENGTPLIGVEWVIPVFHSPRLGLAGAVRMSVLDAVDTLYQTFNGIALLVTRRLNAGNAFAGPLRIMFFIGDVAASGFHFGFWPGITEMLRFISFLSVVLFLMNLLPIPATDGGQILLFLIEVVRRKPVRPRTIGRVQYIGFSVLIILILFITFSDILFFLGK